MGRCAAVIAGLWVPDFVGWVATVVIAAMYHPPRQDVRDMETLAAEAADLSDAAFDVLWRRLARDRPDLAAFIALKRAALNPEWAERHGYDESPEEAYAVAASNTEALLAAFGPDDATEDDEAREAGPEDVLDGQRLAYPRWIENIAEPDERQQWMSTYDSADPDLRRVLDRGDDAVAALAEGFSAEELAAGADYYERKRLGQLSLTERLFAKLRLR